MQDAGYAYNSVEGLMTAVAPGQFPQLLESSFASDLARQGISNLYTAFSPLPVLSENTRPEPICTGFNHWHRKFAFLLNC